MAVGAMLLDNWITEALDKSKGAYRVIARYEVEPDHCPKCGSISRPHGHGPKTIEYTDAPVHGKQMTVVAEVKRYRCRDCGSTFMQPLPDVHPKRRMMMRCVEHIQEQGLVQTFAQIARDVGVDEKTVRDICSEKIDQVLAEHEPYAPLILGIDELHLLGKKRSIFTDVGERRVIDLIETMDRPAVIHWLYHLPNKERIRVVTMDMWGPYRDVVKGVLPNAVVVTDKWHLQKKANEVLDLLRNRARRNSKGKAKSPWRARRLLQASRKTLSPQRLFILDGRLKNDPLLSAAWHCKEAFYDIWDTEDRADAEARFHAWRRSIPDEVSEFRGVANTIDRWYDEVFNYFDFKFTNAYTESANGLIKMTNRAGRGYNNFKNLRARAISMPIRGKTRFSVCHLCLGVNERPAAADDAVLHIIPKHPELMPRRAHNLLFTCHRCNAFHTEDWFKRGRASTVKSG